MKRIQLYILLTVLSVNNIIGQNAENYHKTTDWWEVDTIIVYDTSGNMALYTYTYNDKGYLESCLIQHYMANQWETQSKVFYTYDARGNKLTEFATSKYSSDTSKRFYTYDNNNNLLTITSMYSKNIYQFANNNNLLSELYQSFDGDSNKLINSSLTTYEYNENNNCIKKLYEMWSNNQWNINTLTTYTYNMDNKETERLTQRVKNNQLENASRLTYIYDGNSNLLEQKSDNWSNNTWESSSRFTRTYDMNNNQLTDFAENYSYGTWFPNQYRAWTYDENNNMLTESKLKQWGNDWIEDVRYSWEYDEHSNAVSGLYQRLMVDSTWIKNYTPAHYVHYNNMQSKVFTNVFQGYKFTASYKKSEKNTGIITCKQSDIVVFPNPAQSQITITNTKNAEIQLYSIIGQEVLRSYGKEENTIVDIGFLPQGLYMLKVVKDGSSFVYKVVVRQ